jgi:serine/threonine protein kinase
MTAPSVSDRLLPCRSRIGSWLVGRELGRGGMASVHEVVHTKFGGRAAIKIAHRAIFNDAFTPAMFLREARITHAVEHPGVIDIRSTGTHDGRPYMVMEKLVGRSLGARVDGGGSLTREQALDVLLELCDILRAAHAKGVVHRDLKLDNVLVLDTPYAPGKHVKLLDWGVAHVAGEDDPFRGLIAGTLVYVAPELIRGDAVTPAADVYSLAVLAYHLLCRRPPFAAGSDLALISMHLRSEPPRASLAWCGIPDDLDELLYAMLSKLPGERPTLEDVERGLRMARARLGSGPLPDPFGRPVLPAPPLTAGWISLAIAVSAAVALISALP